MEIVQRGAEAVLYLDELDGQKVLVKERVKKGYRIPMLDERIRFRRTRQEAELLSKARRAGVNTPKVLDMTKDKLVMEWIQGKRIKDVFNEMAKNVMEEVAGMIGETIGALHAGGVVHGDLTTSNMILGENGLYIIDFGLGKSSQKVEDQAVDLYLLYEALQSTHFKWLEEAWKAVLNAYKLKYPKANMILSRIEEIKTRRRYGGKQTT